MLLNFREGALAVGEAMKHVGLAAEITETPPRPDPNSGAIQPPMEGGEGDVIN